MVHDSYDPDRFVTEGDFAVESESPSPRMHVVMIPEAEAHQSQTVEMSSMPTVDRIAFLTAVRDAVDEVLAWQKKTLIERLEGATENGSFPTPMGPISYTASTRKMKVDEEKFLVYMREHHPDMVEEKITYAIDPEARATVLAAFVDIGDGVFASSVDGTVADFLFLGEPTNPSIAYPATKQQKVTKRQARETLKQFLPELAAPVVGAAKGITS